MNMELFLEQEGLNKANIIFVPVLQSERDIITQIKKLAYEDETAILKRLKTQGFVGNRDEFFVIPDNQQILVLLGSGQGKKFSVNDWRYLSAQMAN